MNGTRISVIISRLCPTDFGSEESSRSTIIQNLLTPHFEIEFAGKKFLLDSVSGTDLVAATIASGTYEAPLPMVLTAMVARTSGMFLDVGANNGVYSIITASLRPDISIAAFEPYPPVTELLRRNIALNGFGQQIQVFDIALSDKEGLAPIFLPPPGHGLVDTSASLQSDFAVGSSEVLSVATQRLDNLSLGQPIGIAKIDIEGYELEFIRGAEQTIRRDRPVMFAEMLPVSNDKFSEITKRMADLDYLLFRLRPDMVILTHWISFDAQAWNYCLLPKEKMNLLREVCAVHGLDILGPV